MDERMNEFIHSDEYLVVTGASVESYHIVLDLTLVRIALRTKVCVFTKITAIRRSGHWLHTHCSAYRSTQPSTLRGTVNEYQSNG